MGAKLVLAAVAALLATADALFPGAVPDEGDVRHIYPPCTVAIALGSDSFALPWLLGWVENLFYPKNRLHIDFYLLPESKEDATGEQIKWWRSRSSSLFASVSVSSPSDWPEGRPWSEVALSAARKKKSSFLLLWSGSDLPTDERLLAKITQSKAVMTSLLVPPVVNEEGEPWNVEEAQLDEGELAVGAEKGVIEVTMAALPLLLRLSSSDADYLTFDASNLVHYEGPRDEMSVLSESAERMGIPLLLQRSLHGGWHFDPLHSIQSKDTTLRYQLAHLIADSESSSLPLPVSRAVRPYVNVDKLGFYKVYVINLARRPERRRKMLAACSLIGLDCEIFVATDGKSPLPEEYGSQIRQLEGYLDPIQKRPMKNGEIGCFLSHYRIWEAVAAAGESRVLVLEDDVRFGRDALSTLAETIEDIEKKAIGWDLIYLGRKRMHSEAESPLPGVRQLVSVGYSYWTIGYALSLAGAKRLLKPRPLGRILPVDEYLPLMADVHPNREWSERFEIRDLRAFAFDPPIIQPAQYTNHPLYISDTEGSEVLSESLPEVAAKEVPLLPKTEL